MPYTHPNWHPGAPDPEPPPDTTPETPDAPRPSYRPLSRTASTVREVRGTVAAEGSIIPIVYGRYQIGARIAAVGVWGSVWNVLCIWCLGEIDSIETVRNGEDAISAAMRHDYTGTTTQTADSWLTQAIAGYADTLVGSYVGQSLGVAYSVVRAATNGDFPRPVATLKGRKVYDPRTTTTVWSDNPALCLADLITNTAFGKGLGIDWASVETVADYCDEVLADGSKRYTLNIALDRVASVDDWVETLRTYAHCWVVPTADGKVKLVANAPGTSTFSFDEDNILAGSLQLARSGRGDAPTVVSVSYTQTVDSGGAELATWRDNRVSVRLPGVDTGTVQWRETRLQMPGYSATGQAYREGTAHLARWYYADFTASWSSFDEALAVEVGDIVTLSHPLMGAINKDMRVTGKRILAPGRYAFEAVEYNTNEYDETAWDPEGSPDTDLPSPFEPPSVESLAVAEEIYQLQTGKYASRLSLSWDTPSFPYIRAYRVRVYGGIDPDTGMQDDTILAWQADTVGEIDGTSTVVKIGPVQELAVLTIYVQIVTSVSTVGTAVSTQITPQGKYIVPGDVPSITATRVGADAVLLTWGAAVDIDIERYELRYGGTDWDTASVLEAADVLSYRHEPVAPGTHYYWVKAIDSVRQESVNAASTNIALTTPPDVTGLIGYEVGGEARLSWTASASQFVKRYELRWGSPGVTWGNANSLNIVDAVRYETKSIPQGQWDFLVKALDNAGNESANAARVSFVVSVDASAFLLDAFRIERAASVQNMFSWWHRPEGFGGVDEDLFVAEFYDGTLTGWDYGGDVTAAAGKVTLAGSAAYMIADTLIDYDPELRYNLQVSFRSTGDDVEVRIGYAGVASDGVTIIDRYGVPSGVTLEPVFLALVAPEASGAGTSEHHWHTYRGASLPTVRSTLNGYTKGQSDPGDGYPATGDDPAMVHPDVVYLRPVIVLAPSGAGDSTAEIEVDGVRVSRQAPDVVHYATSFADDMDTQFPSPMVNYTNPIASYHSSGSSEWISYIFDAGLEVTGDWAATITYDEVSAPTTAVLQLSSNGSTWVDYEELAAKVSARYARIKISTTTVGTAHIYSLQATITLNALPRSENGTGTTSTGGKKTITLQNLYAAVKSITVSPFGQPYPATAVVDNIDHTGETTTFDVYVFNAADGVPVVGADFTYAFEGI